MVLVVLCKLILQMRMLSHPGELDVRFLVVHTSCVRTAKALARWHRCAGLPEHSLVAYVISNIISWAGSIKPEHHLLCGYDEALDPWRSIEHSAKTLIKLHRLAGWSESSLGANHLLILSCWSSYYFGTVRPGLDFYRINLKNSDTRKKCNYPKIWVWFYHKVMHPKDADGMANSVDPDQQSDLCLHHFHKPVCRKP